MQFLAINNDVTLSQLAARVGSRNVDDVLQTNGVKRTHRVGSAYNDMCSKAITDYQERGVDGSLATEVSYSRKMTILNSLTAEADVFETVALQDGDSWKVLSSTNTIYGYLRMPPTVELPGSSDILGGTGIAVTKAIYTKAMGYLSNQQDIDPSIFSEYSSRYNQSAPGASSVPAVNWFNIPWGEITLYSSLSGDSMDFPVYPDDWANSVQANYDTMPELIYQYEPWQIYKSSGPRSVSYTFKMHRDMWSGDHRDGKCNELIRFCEANCYPRYNGAAVQTSTVTLYIAGQSLITGVLTGVKTSYSGPIGLDSAPLFVDLTLDITEVSAEALNYDSVKRKGVIG